MRHRRTGPDYSVIVEGTFVGSNLWFIHAVIDYANHSATGAPPRFGPLARTELLRGIDAVSARGWKLGARKVCVVIDGDHELAGLFEALRREVAPDRVA